VGRLLLICLGGALGTGVRYVVSGLAARLLGADFPTGP
jgi:fluoride exporter